MRWKNGGRSRVSTSSFSAIMHALPMTFSSSRILPGQEWRARTEWARGVMPRMVFEYSVA